MEKPGWIRLSIHPTTTNAEIQYVCACIKALAQNHKNWSTDYTYNSQTNEFTHKKANANQKELLDQWFKL
jgi:hypothetical protein